MLGGVTYGYAFWGFCCAARLLRERTWMCPCESSACSRLCCTSTCNSRQRPDKRSAFKPLLRSTSRSSICDKVRYPHKRSIVSWDKAECRVTDLIQPLTNIFPPSRHPLEGVGDNRSASPDPIYDSELRGLVFMVGRAWRPVS